jgi:glutathione S-transferase
MSIQLFYFPGSCAVASHIILEETGLAFDPIAIDLSKSEHHSPEYLRINPKGHVPALIHDGFLVTENIDCSR